MTNSEFKPNTKNLKIHTESGFVNFKGILKSYHDSYIRVTFSDGTTIDTSKNHLFLVGDEWVSSCDLVPTMVLSGCSVFSIEHIEESIELYDVIGSDTGTYYTNGVLSHNCAFISSSGTLVNSIFIEGMKTKDPVKELGDLRIFVEDLSGRNLAMACDVSEGIGQDYHALQIFDIDSFEQVAEFHNNMLTQTQYVKEIIKIIEYFYSEGIAELYYTIEANSVGQGVMRLIENSDNVSLNKATLISDDGGKRLGMITTAKSKLSGCIELKDMIEMQKLTIHSSRLITELKFFIRTGPSFAAEPGTHDDLVMAMVLMMNMLRHLANYEDTVFDVINELDGLDREDETWGIF